MLIAPFVYLSGTAPQDGITRRWKLQAETAKDVAEDELFVLLVCSKLWENTRPPQHFEVSRLSHVYHLIIDKRLSSNICFETHRSRFKFSPLDSPGSRVSHHILTTLSPHSHQFPTSPSKGASIPFCRSGSGGTTHGPSCPRREILPKFDFGCPLTPINLELIMLAIRLMSP